MASTAPVPKYAATSLAATAAALAGRSLNLNTCLVLITCQYPVVHRASIPLFNTLTDTLCLPPQEECALLLPRKVCAEPLVYFND
jgi:hypothetical protein